MIGGEFIIGHFGRVANSCYPHSFLHILPRILERFPHVRVMFAHKKVPIKNKNIKTVSFSYSKMPYAISACDLILYNYRDGQGHIAGSMKILEAMACGVPVLSPRYDARVEELGCDYELFYPYYDICETNAAPTQDRFPEEIEYKMFNLISSVITDSELRDRISKKMIERSKFYSIKNSSKRFEKLFKSF
jgi:glycosyltransferase involved in cell wall biosynthesis